MKGKNGVQYQGLELYSEFLKKVKNDRMIRGIDKKMLSDKLLSRLIARYFKHYRNEYKILVNADIDLSLGKDLKKIQLNAHREFIEFKEQLKDDRIRARKERNKELADWRLSMTLVKYFESPGAYEIMLNTRVNQNE